ncbi:MAG: PAS domain S-box protein [bacterium]|nr:PAS domain S-box protein [bacterium]
MKEGEPQSRAPSAEKKYADALHDMASRYERLVKGFAILRQIDSFDSPDLDVDEICMRLLDAVATGLPAENCSLMLLQEDGKFLELRAACSALEDQGAFFGPGFWSGKRFRVGEGIVGQAVKSGWPIRVNDVHEDVHFIPVANSRVRVRSLMCFPLKVDDTIIGVLNVSHSRKAFFSVESEHVLSLVADRSARLLMSHLVHRRRRESEEYFRLVAENAGDAILVADRESRVLSANPAAARLSGVAAERLNGGGVDWLEGVEAADRSAFEAHRTLVLNELRTHMIEYRYRDAGGDLHYLEERSSPTYDAVGSCSGAVSVIRDVTDRKRNEDEKRELEAQLRHAQKMEAIGELAGGMAHDFNNLLTPIIGNVSLARTFDDPRRAHDLLVEAEKAARRAAAVVKQLLVFGRRTSVDMKPVGMSDIASEIVQIARSTFDRRLEIAAHVADDLPPVMADEGQIHQVLLNLCVNARDALLGDAATGRTDPLRIIIRADGVTVTEAEVQANPSARPGDYVRLSVVDNGPGMDERTRTRVFEPFFTTKENEQGTGLGLAIVYGIVQQHGGWITLDSCPAEGTVFSVFLKTCPHEAMPAEGQEAGRSVPRGEETVLLVDDEELVRNVGRTIMERLGYTVLLASDGEEGLDVYERERGRIDAVVLDLSMPRMSGEEVLQRIREEDPDARIIISSGHSVDGLADSPPPFTPSGCLRKPYSHSDMAHRLREVLDAGASAGVLVDGPEE